MECKIQIKKNNMPFVLTFKRVGECIEFKFKDDLLCIPLREFKKVHEFFANEVENPKGQH